MELKEILEQANRIAEKLGATVETTDYSQFGWYSICIGYGEKLSRRDFILLSIPLENPCLRYFDNDIAKYYKDFDELEKVAELLAKKYKSVKFEDVPDYD